MAGDASHHRVEKLICLVGTPGQIAETLIAMGYAGKTGLQGVAGEHANQFESCSGGNAGTDGGYVQRAGLVHEGATMDSASKIDPVGSEGVAWQGVGTGHTKEEGFTEVRCCSGGNVGTGGGNTQQAGPRAYVGAEVLDEAPRARCIAEEVNESVGGGGVGEDEADTMDSEGTGFEGMAEAGGADVTENEGGGECHSSNSGCSSSACSEDPGGGGSESAGSAGEAGGGDPHFGEWQCSASTRHAGVVTRVHLRKGYGFVRVKDPGCVAFFHASDVVKEQALCVGDPIVCNLTYEKVKGRWRAVQCEKLNVAGVAMAPPAAPGGRMELVRLCSEVFGKGYGEGRAGMLLHGLALQLETIAAETLQWLAKDDPADEQVRVRLSMMRELVRSLDEVR